MKRIRGFKLKHHRVATLFRPSLSFTGTLGSGLCTVGQGRAGSQGPDGGVRGQRRRRRSPTGGGAGDILQPPAVRGAAEGGGGSVRVQPPRWAYDPVPVLRVRKGPDPGRRRRRLPEVADVEEGVWRIGQDQVGLVRFGYGLRRVRSGLSSACASGRASPDLFSPFLSSPWFGTTFPLPDFFLDCLPNPSTVGYITDWGYPRPWPRGAPRGGERPWCPRSPFHLSVSVSVCIQRRGATTQIDLSVYFVQSSLRTCSLESHHQVLSIEVLFASIR
ncbi:hypothetical protein Acr_14g0004000 [Actinidia rufa]|uniref:Uncharacterized protein n=1 Tax=Actinidia rufa TaxID=165716 RepID=A0A7J0FPX2_9ERIC|nr:hypothetical protein Acr_14g0004000 [Actinidia rufa]